jgi:Fe-S cluster assembly protein SufD
MSDRTTARDRYLAAFETRERQGALQTLPWLGPRRRSAIAHFAARGFPTTRDEDWRYTNLTPLAALPFTPAAANGPVEPPTSALEALALGATDWPRLVFVDGRPWPQRPAPLVGEARLTTLAEAAKGDGALVERHLGREAPWDADVFAALSTAFVEDGAFLHVPADTTLATPIELLFVAATPGVLAQPRILVVAGPHSRVTLVERHLGLTPEPYFTNLVTEIVAGPGSVVDHDVVQEQGAGAFHVATVRAGLERDSTLSTCGVTFGGRLARTTLAVQLRGEGATARLGGLYVLDGHQHVDNHVSVEHAVPRCSSRQLYKGVLDGTARAVFNGRILVRPGAQKTDASQTNKHLLLSDGVEVDSKPQLEIFADDVRCTHGAAEGQLAPEALFYLRSRGLSEAAARGLLVYGFAHEVIERIAAEPLRRDVERALTARLGAPEATQEAA